MLHHLLEQYIPSRSYVRYLQDAHASFTEFETAAILHHTGLPVETKIAVYHALLGETGDAELRRQISEELARLKRVVDLFCAGGAGIAYLTCKDTFHADVIGLAANYETAYALGVHSGADFIIEKYRLLTEYPHEPVLRKSYFNPRLSGSAGQRELVKTYEGTDDSMPAGRFSFRRDGTLLNASSVEEEDQLSDEALLRRYYAPNSFTNTYIDYPNPFDQGDLVTFTRARGEPETESIGIVRTSQEEWEDLRQRIKDGLSVDQFDASLTVEWLKEDGRFSHDHIPPIFLERRETDKSAPWYEVIEAARNLLRGKGSLEWFTMCCDAYKLMSGKIFRS